MNKKSKTLISINYTRKYITRQGFKVTVKKLSSAYQTNSAFDYYQTN